MTNLDPWVAAVVALLTGGTGKYAYDAFMQWRASPPREIRRQSFVDANIATVARARDELEEDNARLRTTLAEERKQRAEVERLHESDRIRWLADQSRLRADVDRLEHRLRVEQAEASARYDALLAQVHQLQARTTQTQEGS